MSTAKDARRRLGTPEIGKLCGVQGHTVIRWMHRYRETDNPFPAADTIIGLDPDHYRVFGWLPSRKKELRAWQLGKPIQAAPVTVEIYLSTTDIGKLFGVYQRTVSQWRIRYKRTAHQFPEPVVLIGDVAGWDRTQIPAIRAWKEQCPGSKQPVERERG